MTDNKPPPLQLIFQRYDPPLFFVIFCTAKRRRVLASPRIHEAFISYGRDALDHKVAVGRYVIMPDHIHLFVQGDQDFELGMWVRGLKRVVAAAVAGGRGERHSPAETAAATTLRRIENAGSLWQRRFFDHLIRNGESYEQKWNYVRDNPIRAGLVVKREEWPYQGEIVEIDHD
jgi:REP element-mobilizing transposase RayT